MCDWIQIIKGLLKKLFLLEEHKDCRIIINICSAISIFLLIPLTYTWIIAEITMPIRCALSEDDKVYMSINEWKQQRKIQELKPIYNRREYIELLTERYSLLTLSEKERIPEFITLNNQIYEFNHSNLKAGLAVYEREINHFDLFITNYWVIYDFILQKIVLSGEEVYSKYSRFIIPGYITCNRKPLVSHRLINYPDYNF